MSKITKKDLEEKFGKPCIEIIPGSIAPTDPSAITPQEITQMRDCLRTSINLIQSKLSVLPPRAFARSLTPRNIGTVQQAVNIAEANPNTVTSAIDVEHWQEVINRSTILDPIIQDASTLIDVATRYDRTFGIEAMQYFGMYYRCVRQLAEDGIAEAITIYEVLNVLYSHLFGRRGPHQCPEDIINTTLQASHNVIVKNKKRVQEIMKEQKFLAEELEHDIHSNIELVDGTYINRNQIPKLNPAKNSNDKTNIIEVNR